MLFIYCLDLETLEPTLCDYCSTVDTVDDLIDAAAVAMIRRESGERAAENAYRDDVEDRKIETDCYFLRHSKTHEHRIDVYQRKTVVSKGAVWNSFDVTVNKVAFFGFTKSSMILPTGSQRVPIFKSEEETRNQALHIEALKERLVSQRKQVDERIANDDQIIVQDDVYRSVTSSDSEEVSVNPFEAVRQKLQELEVSSQTEFVRAPTPPLPPTPPSF